MKDEESMKDKEQEELELIVDEEIKLNTKEVELTTL